MTAEQKELWKKMAEQEKIVHHERYPDFKFSVKAPRKKTSAQVTQDDRNMKMEVDLAFEPERALSCPPGDKVISLSAFESLPPQYGDPLTTRDDLARRPSSTVYYRSAPFDLASEMQDPAFFSNPANQRYYLRESRNRRKYGFSRPPEQESDQQQQQPEARATAAAVGMFCGPRLFDEAPDILRVPLDEPFITPEWRPELSWTMAEMIPRMQGKPIEINRSIPEDFPFHMMSTLPPLPRHLIQNAEVDSFDTLISALDVTSHSQSRTGSANGQTDKMLAKAENQWDTILGSTRNM